MVHLRIATRFNMFLHSSEISWNKKMFHQTNFLKLMKFISCVITDIDKEKRRVAISINLQKKIHMKVFEKKYPVGSTIKGKISNIKDFSIYVEY